MEPRLFDSSKEFDVPIHSGGIKRCVCRFPTDEEWITYESEKKALQRFLGNDKSTWERVNKDGTEFDEAMAVLVIDRLGRANVTEIAYADDQFRVTLGIVDGSVEHVVKDPDAKALLAYRRTTGRTVTNISGRSAELRVNLRAAKELYDEIHVSSAGYAGTVPIIHMEAVCQAVSNQLRIFEEGAGSPEK
jgi:hypothetical protein